MKDAQRCVTNGIQIILYSNTIECYSQCDFWQLIWFQSTVEIETQIKINKSDSIWDKS